VTEYRYHGSLENLSATSSDSSEKGLPLQGHDNTVAVLMQEIARAKDETVKQLQEEYQTEINQYTVLVFFNQLSF
jgi:hypothetical protein